MPSNHLILCHPLLLLPSIFPSIMVFSNESALCIRWPKYWSFSFNISPSNEHPGLISFRMDCLDLLAVQGTLKSLLQHHSLKAWFLRCSAFFIVQLSHPHVTTGKAVALTIWTFVDTNFSGSWNFSIEEDSQVILMTCLIYRWPDLGRLGTQGICCHSVDSRVWSRCRIHWAEVGGQHRGLGQRYEFLLPRN